jgi:hypothetical protein
VAKGINGLTMFIWAVERGRIIFHSLLTEKAIGNFFKVTGSERHSRPQMFFDSVYPNFGS